MNLIRSQEGTSLTLSTKTKSVDIGFSGKSDISVFSSIQETEESNMLHWPGEYEINGIAFLISQPFGKKSIIKIFSEGVRFTFFCDENITEITEDLIQSFGNTDILFLEKSTQEKSLSKGNIKKLIEKIDPRILIIPQGNTADAFAEYNFPFISKEKLVITYSSLPKEHTEYIIL